MIGVSCCIQFSCQVINHHSFPPNEQWVGWNNSPLSLCFFCHMHTTMLEEEYHCNAWMGSSHEASVWFFEIHCCFQWVASDFLGRNSNHPEERGSKSSHQINLTYQQFISIIWKKKNHEAYGCLSVATNSNSEEIACFSVIIHW
jgi:hypothetical protein